jgi:glyoxylase-like metal-dependent hydrolase (beta-lactamase superfamily II)
MSRLPWVTGWALTVLAAAQTAAAQERSFTTTRLADGLHVIHGHPGGNVILQTGADGALLVDAQSAGVEDSVDAMVRRLADQPVRLIINTHYHEDHIGGNAAFRSQGAEVIAHARLRARAVVDTTIDELEWHREPAHPDDLPSIEIGTDTTLRWNGATIDLIALNAAHTDGDVAVYFREADVLHTGDVVEVDAYPFVDWWGGGSLDGTIAAVDRLLSLVGERTRIVPGHGHIVDRPHLLQYRSMLATVRERVLAAIDAGEDLSSVMDRGLSAEWDDDRGGTSSGRRFVGILFLGLSTARPGS